MKRFFPVFAAILSILACAPFARALTPKPNVAPVVSGAITAPPQYRGTTRAIDMTPFFSDPDASAAVQVNTVAGVMNFTLDGQQAPLTVANFLNYVESGRYYKTDPVNGQQASVFFHRSVPGFVIQTGGFYGTVNSRGNVFEAGFFPAATPVLTYPPVVNEPFISNLRGTIAMAKLGGDPNSATSQWFVNLADNSANLDNQNGGFTVFGRVAGNGMAVADAIAALPKINAGSPYDAVPVRDYTSPNPVKVPNLISIPSISRISPLTYSASSSNPAVATVTSSGRYIAIKSLQVGTAQITVTATDLDGASVSQSLSVNIIPAPARLGNISTRVSFANRQSDLIAGFIVRGGTSKMLAGRAIGPSLANFIPNPIEDPTLELHDVNTVIDPNDDWVTRDDQDLITALGLAPGSNKESVVQSTVPSSNGNTSYTAVMRNAAGNFGIGLVEIYDLDSAAGSTIVNLSSRGTVGLGANVMIGGFIISGDGTRRLVVRAVGPSLTQYGVAGALRDPMIELRNEQGTILASNDDWQSDPPAAVEIQGYGLQPSDSQESAVIATLGQGNYTAILSGNGNTPTGVASIEIYQVQ
ncbi:MAG: peptidylprolyl isomerase [Chthoniobacterales bacterium]